MIIINLGRIKVFCYVYLFGYLKGIEVDEMYLRFIIV